MKTITVGHLNILFTFTASKEETFVEKKTSRTSCTSVKVISEKSLSFEYSGKFYHHQNFKCQSTTKLCFTTI